MPPTLGSVIVVDDDDAVRNSLKFALELEGLSVRAYGGGAELLADGDVPEGSCLVVDYNMPTMTGMELVDRLRLRNVSIPAILITGNASDDVRRRAKRAGFLRVLEKPLDDGSLLETIRGALAPA
ncbi:response regulator transcription factor [Salinarimonas soli]|uniref:Response regulator n=1 Tax=Salinarimonas soli TaxID=1638099 RepID=A0A5B2VYE0_9HYPH|nr:response regulator [Salinarimonas soli]KAA2244055.1 response regulator [Salinarimonas soli]